MALDSMTIPARQTLRIAESNARVSGRRTEASDVITALTCVGPCGAASVLKSFGIESLGSESTSTSTSTSTASLASDDEFICSLTLESFADAFRAGLVFVDTVGLLRTLVRLDSFAIATAGIEPDELVVALTTASRPEPREEVAPVGDEYREAMRLLMEMADVPSDAKQRAQAYWREHLREIADAAARAAKSASSMDRHEAFRAAYVHAADQVFAEVRQIAGLR